MILITGDTHGDMTRFAAKQVKTLKKNDSLIICGDFGFIWDGSNAEKHRLKQLGRKKYNILFVEGVHENFEELQKYDIEEWCGGMILILILRTRRRKIGGVWRYRPMRSWLKD